MADYYKEAFESVEREIAKLASGEEYPDYDYRDKFNFMVGWIRHERELVDASMEAATEARAAIAEARALGF